MRGERRSRGKEKIFHRMLALLMVAILLISDQNLSVLAENETSNVGLSEEEASDEVSMEEIRESDEDSMDGTGDSGDTEDESELPDDEENDDKNICVCGSRCSADTVNADCPVCVENYENCGGLEKEETEEDAGSIEDGEGELPDETELPEETEQLTEAAITEDGVEAKAGPEDKVLIEEYADDAEFEDSSGIKYKVVGDGQVEIIGHKDRTSVSGTVVIPATVVYGGSTYSLTSIGQDAFYNCDSLISIELPDGLTSIGQYAFYNCDSLTSIELPDSLTSIGKHAFFDCISLTSIELPNNLTSINSYAFRACRSLTSIELPDSLTSIDEGVFSWCDNLTNIEIPDSVTSIGESAFNSCDNLTSIVIPDNVTSIGNAAFWDCSSLTSIEIPDSVTSIGQNTFRECSSLTSIKIPNGITSIGLNAFSECKELRTLQIVIPSDETDIIIPEVHLINGRDPFYATPDDRYIVFVSEDGAPLTGDALKAAQYTFKADQKDGKTTDNLWWGWNLGELDDSEITINVQKDNSDWSDHTRKFGLKPTAYPDAALITDFTSVADGQYRIYDITDAADSISGIDTGETITVSNGAGEATVDYYTVTFYDGDTAYAADSPQKAQTVLKGKKASKPADPDPVKTGHQFKEWVTEKGGSSPFDFENTVIENTTNVYADWTADTYNITYHLDGYKASQKESTYTYGIGITLPAPTQSGYDFDGWYTNADYSGQKVTSIGSTETGNKVYYGQWIKKPVSTYRVSVKVQRDDDNWTDHTRKFALQSVANPDAPPITDFTSVAAGQYKIYDITNAADGTSGIDTEETITVSNGNKEATVNYYTVTFYDGSAVYEDSTPQAMQTVLSGQTAKKPEAPSKEGYTFNRWMTTNNGSEAFNFNVPIEHKSNVYASWISNATTEYNIKASAGKGGSISPEGSVRVQEGGTQTFEITPNDGYRIKAVTVDGVDRTDELTDSARARAVRAQAETSRYYTFVNVKESHTIRAAFETEDNNDNTGVRVSVKVTRDGDEWKDHGKTFMLLTETGSLTANLEKVAQGTYYIYDATGGVNTGVRVSVEDKDVEVTANYYTVTFYDGSTAYGNSTPQAMQTVLSGKTAREPEAPSKEGYTFNRWMTTNNGSEAFNFNVPIEHKSNVYASWISNVATEYNIEASAGKGGSISPKGSVRVQEGGTQTFEITPDNGYRIKTVTVDGRNSTNELTNSARARDVRARAETSRYYTFVNIRQSHTIRVTFEAERGNGNTGTGGGSRDNDSNVIKINIVNSAENTGGSPTEIMNNGNRNDDTTNPSKDTEPKTDDVSRVEVYATMAMIAGLTYLLLYFADRKSGMTEERKQELVSSMIRWAKKGSRIRKYMVLVPIFILLCYYHSIGKCVDVELENIPV